MNNGHFNEHHMSLTTLASGCEMVKNFKLQVRQISLSETRRINLEIMRLANCLQMVAVVYVPSPSFSLLTPGCLGDCCSIVYIPQ